MSVLFKVKLKVTRINSKGVWTELRQEQREKAATPLGVATHCCGSAVAGSLEEKSV